MSFKFMFDKMSVLGWKMAFLCSLVKPINHSPLKHSPYEILEYKNKKQLPTHFRIEACTLCQLKCKECYMRKSEITKKLKCGKGYLKFKDFKKFCENNVVESVALSNNGEIFLNPDLLKIMEYSYNHNIKLIDNNGVNFNDVKEEVLEGLVKYEFEKLSISLDGASQETYVQYRVGGNFDKVINNIKRVNYYKQKYNKEYPHIIWKFILFGHNEHEIPKAKEMAKELNCEIIFVPNWSPNFSPLKDIDFIKKELGNDAQIFIKDAYKTAASNDWVPPCYQMWKEPQINYDGQLQGCCVYYDYDYGVNVFKDGLLKALNSKLFVDAKRAVSGYEPKYPDKLMCKKCRYYNAMKETGIYMVKGRK